MQKRPPQKSFVMQRRARRGAFPAARRSVPIAGRFPMQPMAQKPRSVVQTPRIAPTPTATSWGTVADWYDTLVEGEGSYQKDLILPNVLRILAPKKGMRILDVACGQGFFSRAFAGEGATVIAADVAPELIARAKAQGRNVQYYVAPANAMPFAANGSMDAATIILALQNIEDAHGTLVECARVLAHNGRLLLVMNHPCFRIPRASSWGWDEATTAQYRRIDRYMSEQRTAIAMHPGDAPEVTTTTFHRPLQLTVKMLRRAGFAITLLEEWTSHKKSERGPRAVAEDRARKEFPLFLCIEAQRLAH